MMCLAQFVTHYQYTSRVPKGTVFEQRDDYGAGVSEKTSDQEMFTDKNKKLPNYLELRNDMGKMRLRTRPLVLRLHDAKKKEGATTTPTQRIENPRERGTALPTQILQSAFAQIRRLLAHRF